MGRRLSEAEILATRFGIGPKPGRRIKIEGEKFMTETTEGRKVNKASLIVRINGERYRARIETHSVDLSNDRDRVTVWIKELGREDRCTCREFADAGDCVHLGALRALRIIPGVRRPVGRMLVGEGIEEEEGWDEGNRE